MQLYVLIYVGLYFILFLLQVQVSMLILANVELIGKCEHVCAQEYICICVHMYVYMCIHAYVYVLVYEPRCMCILQQVFML